MKKTLLLLSFCFAFNGALAQNNSQDKTADSSIFNSQALTDYLASVSSNQLKFKTIKFLEKNSLNKTVILKIIETIKFDKNITYDLYLSKIQSNMRGKKE